MPIPSGLHEIVGDEEVVARFVVSSSWVARTTGRVKHQAFLPAPDHDTSVFRTDGCERVWDMATHIGRAVHGAALVKTRFIRVEDLDVLSAEPPHRHANIRGWPLDPDLELQKSKRKEKAMAIADEALFLDYPELN